LLQSVLQAAARSSHRLSSSGPCHTSCISDAPMAVSASAYYV